MEILFSCLIFAFAIPAWVPILWNRKLWPKLKRGEIAVTFSALMQLIFMACSALGLITLDYSVRFAAVGVPSCILALAFALADTAGSVASVGVVISAFLGLAIWLFLLLLH